MHIGRLRITMIILYLSLLVLLVVLLSWLARVPQGAIAKDQASEWPSNSTHATLRLGIMPERDIFEQRRRYRVLADYLSDALDCRVTLVTSSSYVGALQDMAEAKTDAAFMGSLVAAQALEQLNARVLVKPESPNGVSTYRGVIFVRDDSPIQHLDDMAGRSLAMVRTTTAGHLFPVHRLMEHDLLTSENPVVLRWLGTHDQVIESVYEGTMDAGAAKDLRLDAFEAGHAPYRFRRLVLGQAVPNNALVVRRELEASFANRLAEVLLAMDQQPAGQEVLKLFDAQRFLTCEPGEYQAVFEMIQHMGPGWESIGLNQNDHAQAVMATPAQTTPVHEPPARPSAATEGP